jgi:type IV secretion system protein VirB6
MKQFATRYNSQMQTIFTIALVLFAVPLLTYFLTGTAAADEPRCTDDPDFNVVPLGGAGLIQILVTNIKNILGTIAANMYGSIIGNGTFVAAVRATATLYIAIYGLMFTVGIIQITISDLVIRGIKLAIVGLLISGSSMSFFADHVVRFFNDGTDELINVVTMIAVGGVNLPGGPASLGTGGGAFVVLDQVLNKMLSSQMIVIVMALFAHGPGGPIIALFLVTAIGAFMRSIFKAMWVYLMSLVMKTLLFGLAPIFIACLLFTRTKHLFDGWLNQLLNASLQPILLFAFFAFFARLVEACIDSVMTAPVCWTPMADGLRGSRFAEYFWRFKVDNAMFDGVVNFTGPVKKDSSAQGNVIPIDIVVILMFLFLSELATRFNDIVIEVAKDISHAMTNFSALAGSANHWFGQAIGGDAGGKQGGGGGGGGKSKANPLNELFNNKESLKYAGNLAQGLGKRSNIKGK